MARYRPVYVQIWEDDEQFLDYSDTQKVLFFYLITNKNCSESGIYKMSIKNVSHTLNWLPELLLNTVAKLEPNVYYDPDTHIVFVKNFLQYNGLKHGNPEKIAKSIAKDCQEFHTKLWRLFKRTYPNFMKTLQKFGETIYDYDSNNNFKNEDSYTEKEVMTEEDAENFTKTLPWNK